MFDRLLNELINTMNEYDFMINHDKEKLKEVTKIIRQLSKINEKIENKVDLDSYLKERDNYLNSLSELKKDVKKLNRIYKILINTNEFNKE